MSSTIALLFLSSASHLGTAANIKNRSTSLDLTYSSGMHNMASWNGMGQYLMEVKTTNFPRGMYRWGGSGEAVVVAVEVALLLLLPGE